MAICRCCAHSNGSENQPDTFVETYKSAEAFLEFGDQDQSAALILDVHLPDQNGLELQNAPHLSNREVPIILVTAFGNEQARAIEAGTIAFLYKPLDSETLLDVIQAAIDR